MKKLLTNQQGSSMLLAVSIFLILSVLGISLMNAANVNVSNTSREYEKEQALLYVGSIYDTVNTMVETGKFSDATGKLPTGEVRTQFTAGDNQNIDVTVKFTPSTSNAKTEMTVQYKHPLYEKKQSYKITSSYTQPPGAAPGTYRLSSCKGLEEVGTK